VNVTQWQTQQGTDSSSAIAAPFDKLPQLTVNYMRADIEGFDWTLNTDLTHFSVNRTFYCRFYSTSAYCNQQNALRLVANNYLSRPFLTSYGYITPKLSLSARQYQYDETYKGTYGTSAASNSDGVVVPTFSLDTGAVLERPVKIFNNSWTQTIEPRAFYVYTPYRYQSDLPNYDTGSNDFNFATVFTENSFSGQDRISDSHTFTLGGTSRLINPESGAEGARFGLAQRQHAQLGPEQAALIMQKREIFKIHPEKAGNQVQRQKDGGQCRQSLHDIIVTVTLHIKVHLYGRLGALLQAADVVHHSLNMLQHISAAHPQHL
jgi:LPS-assembly protein